MLSENLKLAVPANPPAPPAGAAAAAAAGTAVPAAQARPEPYLKIRPQSGWAALQLAEVWRFRDLLVSLAARDVKLRYRQTILGAAWVVLQPLLAAGIFSLVFGLIAKLPSAGAAPYFVVAFAGQLAWSVFSNTISKTSSSMVGNANLVSKVYFPRLVLPLSTILSTLLDFAVAAGMLVAVLAWYRINPGLGVLLLPLWLGLLLLFSLGLGLICAALMVTYRDVGYVLPVLVQLLMYASPVGYTLGAARQRLTGRLLDLYMLNPLASLMEAFRRAALGQGELQPGHLAYAAACSVAVFVAGAFMFKKMERRFADVI